MRLVVGAAKIPLGSVGLLLSYELGPWGSDGDLLGGWTRVAVGSAIFNKN